MTNSPNIGLPFISASQAQKHVTHNEAITALDTLVQLAVESASVSTPPSEALEGARYIVPTGATDAWAGHEGQIAQKEVGGWRFVAPSPGSRVWIKDSAVLAVFDGADWVDYRTLIEALSVSQIGVNATADATNRLAVSASASLLNHEGSSHRLIINKNTAGDTASQVFQNAFSGRAELGLAGDDDFSVKVSPDGSIWQEALRADADSGRVSFPVGISAPGLPIRVLQSVSTTGFTTTQATPQATGLAVTLTPLNAASKILVRCHLTIGGYFWSNSPSVTVERDGVKVWPASSGVTLAHHTIVGSLTNTRSFSYSASFEFLDEPANDTPVTYEVMLASTVAGHNVHLNLRDIDLTLRGESSMFVTEISG